MLWLYLFVLMTLWLVRFGLQKGELYLSIFMVGLWILWLLSLRAGTKSSAA